MKLFNTCVIFAGYLLKGLLKCILWILYSPILFVDLFVTGIWCIVAMINEAANYEHANYEDIYPKKLWSIYALGKIKALWRKAQSEAVSLKQTQDRSDKTLLRAYEKEKAEEANDRLCGGR